MSCQSAAPSSRSNSIPLADQTISCFTSSLPRRLRHLQLGTSHTLVRPLLSSPPVELLEFHDMDSVTVLYIDDDPDWINTPIPVPTSVFQTPPPVTNCNLFNNQLAKAL